MAGTDEAGLECATGSVCSRVVVNDTGVLWSTTVENSTGVLAICGRLCTKEDECAGYTVTNTTSHATSSMHVRRSKGVVSCVRHPAAPMPVYSVVWYHTIA